MFRLLRIEFLKVRPYKTFWAFLIIYALLIFLFASAASKIQPAYADSEAIFSFPAVWYNLAYMASFLSLLPGILMILLVSNEFTYKTFRQNVIDGLSREQAVTGKFVLIKAIALGCVLFLFLFGLIKGLLAGHFAHVGQIFRETHYLLRLFFQLVGYMAIAAVLAFLIKRAALTILVYLIYLVALERILRTRIPDEIERYLPVYAMDSLIPSKFQMPPIPGFTQVEPLSVGILIFLTVVYFLVCLTASRLLIQRSAL